MRARRTSLRSVAVAVSAGVLVLSTTLPAAAGGGRPSPDTPTVVASGLNNPRQLSFDAQGNLYVAEAGSGGAGPCMTGPEGGSVCFGPSGSITKISRGGTQSRVVTGLPSIGGQGTGEQALGASDVLALPGGSLAVLIGLGGSPALRAGLPVPAQRMGTLQLVTRSGRFFQLADVARFEEQTNPIHDVDSDPVGLDVSGGRFVIADAGGNTVVSLSRQGLKTVAVFPDQTATFPDGTTGATQSVPTSAVRGPDGALYVSQLTGFPFQEGLANIYRVDRRGAVSVYASGLTNVTDLAFRGRTLYAVEISERGLLSGPIGALVEVPRNSTSPTVVAGGLFAPYGLAIHRGAAYVTTGSVAPGAGQVMRFPLG